MSLGFHNIIRIKTMLFICLENKLRQMSVHSKRSQKARTQIRSHIVKTKNFNIWIQLKINNDELARLPRLCRRPAEFFSWMHLQKESWNIIYLWNFPILRPLLCCLVISWRVWLLSCFYYIFISFAFCTSVNRLLTV